MIDRNQATQAHSFLAIIKKNTSAIEIDRNLIISALGRKNINYFVSRNNQFQIAFSLRKDNELNKNSIDKYSGQFILGDNNEFNSDALLHVMASASFIEFNFNENNFLKVHTSIVGLPPVFIYKSNDYVILTSNIHLLAELSIDINFDNNGIHEFLSIGHPVGGRTLFENISLLPGGHSIVVNGNGEIELSQIWEFPEVTPLDSMDAYVELQTATLYEAVNSIDLSNTFLSMTAGLDTRAIFSALVRQGRSIPTCTMSARNISLDAQTASKLCDHYKYSHNLIYIDDNFYKDLPDYVLKASRLSAGLSSLGQAQEVYYYEQTANIGNSRISGNLGNQVCRRGVERTKMNNTATSMLSYDLIKTNNITNDRHWFESEEGGAGNIDYEFLLQKEVPYTSVANYSIGSHYATQKTPYANRALIENLSLMPIINENDKQLSPTQMRLRDLLHRFFGHSKDSSFQIRLINDTGGFVSEYPINWGWQAKGGVSLPGVFNGTMAFIDAAASSKGLESGHIANILHTLKIQGMHEYTKPRIWLHQYMKEFSYDLFNSTSILNSGVFNNKNVNKLLTNFYTSGSYNYKELVAAIDLALAYNIFISRD